MKPPVLESGVVTITPQRRQKNDQQLQHEEKVFGKEDQDKFIKTGEIPEGMVTVQYEPAEGYVMPLFSTPFLRGHLNLDVEEVAQSCRDLVGEIEDGNVQTEYTTYFNEEVRTKMHETEWFRKFSNQIKDSYIAFCQNVFNMPVGHLERDAIHLFAWISIYSGPHAHSTHNHVNSHMSGTYYVKTEKSNQPIKFYNPNIGAIANHLAVDRPIERDEFPNIVFDGVEGCDSAFHLDPQEGEFLFWPSYIMHSVEPAQEILEDYERIAISFNLKHDQILDNNTTGDNLCYDFIEENVEHGR